MRPSAPIEDVENIEALRERFPGVLKILETWFMHYESPGNRSRGFADAETAWAAMSDAALPASSSPRR